MPPQWFLGRPVLGLIPKLSGILNSGWAAGPESDLMGAASGSLCCCVIGGVGFTGRETTTSTAGVDSEGGGTSPSVLAVLLGLNFNLSRSEENVPLSHSNTISPTPMMARGRVELFRDESLALSKMAIVLVAKPTSDVGFEGCVWAIPPHGVWRTQSLVLVLNQVVEFK